MPPAVTPFTRTARLVRLASAATAVRDAARLLAVFAAALAAGAAVLVIGRAVLSAPAGVSFSIAAAAVAVASAAGGAACLAAIRRSRRRQAMGFARAARRLGEEKTAASELRRACRRLARSLEEIVPEVLAEEDAWKGEPGGVMTPSRTRSDRARRLAERLRRVSRAASFFGGTDLELRPLALAGPCAEVIEEYRRFADTEQEILYIEDGGGDWLAAPIDRPLFVQALREILDNVLDHGGAWGRITVTTEPVSGAILLKVRDDGQGLTPDQLGAVLAGRAIGEGGGLGIPLVRAIVEAHGGAFRMESDAGRGTVVSLRFPTLG
jgi:signal transduction histidine kinase